MRTLQTKIKNKFKRPKKRVMLSAGEESNNSKSDTDETSNTPWGMIIIFI